MENPIDGIIPDFSIFGAEFTALWQKLFTAGWAIAILACIVFLLYGVVVMANSGDNPHEHASGRKRALQALFALIAVVAFGVIIGAIIFLVG